MYLSFYRFLSTWPHTSHTCVLFAADGLTRIRQHTSAYVSIRQHTCVLFAGDGLSIRQDTSGYVRIRQHTCVLFAGDGLCVSICTFVPGNQLKRTFVLFAGDRFTIAVGHHREKRLHTSAYVSIRLHTSAVMDSPSPSGTIERNACNCTIYRGMRTQT